mgnify:FL=1
MGEPIKIDKWNFYIKRESGHGADESYIDIIFRLSSDHRSINGISNEDIAELEKDLRDLGKWRKFRELKRDLENGN